MTRKQRFVWFLVVALVSLALLFDFTPIDLGAEDGGIPFRGATLTTLAMLTLLGLVAGVLEPRGTSETQVVVSALLITVAAAAPLLAWSIVDMLIPGGIEHNLFPIEWCWHLFYGSACGIGFVLSAGLRRVLVDGPAEPPSEAPWVAKALMLAGIAGAGIVARLLFRPWMLPTSAFVAGALLGRRISTGRLLLLATVVGGVGAAPSILHWGAGMLARGQDMDPGVLFGWIYFVVWSAISSACFWIAARLTRATARGRIAPV